jgi:hypothetical protein
MSIIYAAEMVMFVKRRLREDRANLERSKKCREYE